MSDSPARRIFVAGSTGATGRALMRIASSRGDDVIPHVRPKSAAGADPRAAVFELADAAALTAALGNATTVVQLIGTIRKRFAAGDTYETSDIGTTQQLVDAARAAGTIDHIVLLSSVGAGGVGAYLKAKARAEAIVRSSGIAWTIFRPSMFVGEGHRGLPGADTVTRLLRLRRYQPIQVDDLAATILDVALRRDPLRVALEGASLWTAVARATKASPAAAAAGNP